MHSSMERPSRESSLTMRASPSRSSSRDGCNAATASSSGKAPFAGPIGGARDLPFPSAFLRSLNRDRQPGRSPDPLPPGDLAPGRINSLNMHRQQPHRRNSAVDDAGAVRGPIPFRSGEKAVSDNPSPTTQRSSAAWQSGPDHGISTGRDHSEITEGQRPTHRNSGAPGKKSDAHARGENADILCSCPQSRCAFHNCDQPGHRQEVSALALHLVQASLVYVNTRMVQSVLGDLGWAARLSSDDLRGLETVIYTHINPYLWPLRGRSRPAHRLQEKGRMSVIMGILIVTSRMNTPRQRFAVHFGWFPG